MSYKIEMVCCYCKETFGFKDGGKAPGLVSHGICEACLPAALEEAKRFKEEVKPL